jgi:hypothetical protein
MLAARVTLGTRVLAGVERFFEGVREAPVIARNGLFQVCVKCVRSDTEVPAFSKNSSKMSAILTQYYVATMHILGWIMRV